MRDRTPDIQAFEDTMKILKQGYYEKDGRKIQLKLSAKQREEIQVYLPDDLKTICCNYTGSYPQQFLDSRYIHGL